jgi:hypothetical protein
VDLYIRTLIRLNGIVFNWLSKGTTLPFHFYFVIFKRKFSAVAMSLLVRVAIWSLISECTPLFILHVALNYRRLSQISFLTRIQFTTSSSYLFYQSSKLQTEIPPRDTCFLVPVCIGGSIILRCQKLLS